MGERANDRAISSASRGLGAPAVNVREIAVAFEQNHRILHQSNEVPTRSIRRGKEIPMHFQNSGYEFLVPVPEDFGKWKEIERKQQFVLAKILGISEDFAKEIPGEWSSLSFWKKAGSPRIKVIIPKSTYIGYANLEQAMQPSGGFHLNGEEEAWEVSSNLASAVRNARENSGNTKQMMLDKHLGYLLDGNDYVLLNAVLMEEITLAELAQIQEQVPRVIAKIDLLDDRALIGILDEVGTGELPLGMLGREFTVLGHLKQLEASLDLQLRQVNKRKSLDDIDELSLEEMSALIFRHEKSILLELEVEKQRRENANFLSSGAQDKQAYRDRQQSPEYIALRAKLAKLISLRDLELASQGISLHDQQDIIKRFRESFREVAFDIAWSLLNRLERMAKEDLRLLKRGEARKQIQNSKYRQTWQYVLDQKKYVEKRIPGQTHKKKHPGLQTEDHLDLSDKVQVYIKVEDLLDDIKKVRNKISREKNHIFHQDKLLEEVFKELQIIPGSIQHHLIIIYKPDPDQSFWETFLLVLSIALIPLSFGVSGVGLAATAIRGIDLAISIHFTFQEIEDFVIAEKLDTVGFNSNKPSEFWLIASIVGIGLDLPIATKKNTLERVGILKADLDLDMIDGLTQLQTRLKRERLVAQLNQSLNRSIDAKKKLIKVRDEIFNITTGRLHSLPIDPKVALLYVKLGYHAAQLGIKKFEEFVKFLKHEKLLLQEFSELTADQKDQLIKAHREGVRKLKKELEQGIKNPKMTAAELEEFHKRLGIDPPGTLPRAKAIKGKKISDAPIIKRVLPQPKESEHFVARKILPRLVEVTDWDLQLVFLNGKRHKMKGKIKPRNSRQPEAYSESLGLAVEVKTYPIENFNKMIRRIKVQEGGGWISLPKGTKEWFFWDVRGQDLRMSTLEELGKKLSNRLVTLKDPRLLFEKIYLIGDEVMVVFEGNPPVMQIVMNTPK